MLLPIHLFAPGGKQLFVDAKTLCLAVLSRGPASGYEIKKQLEQPPHRLFQDTSFGSIYPALRRLSDEGAVVAEPLAQKGRPDKKVFFLTEAGRQRLLSALAEPPAPDRLRSDFLFTLLYGDLLPPKLLISLIERRIAEFEEKLEWMQACADSPKSPSAAFLHGLGLTYYRSCLDYLRKRRPQLAAELLEQKGEARERAAE